MEGSISSIKYDKGFGFIKDNSGNDYFFHVTNVPNSMFSDLEKGDKVTFELYEGKNGRIEAHQVRKILIDYETYANEHESKTDDTKAGIHKLVKIQDFSDREKAIITKFSKWFYITRADAHIRLGYSSEYSYFLIKPSKEIQTLFNLKREIIVVLSKYRKFESRDFDVSSSVHKKIGQQLRLEKMCSLIICEDQNTKEEVQAILKTGSEMQVIIPFSFNEIINIATQELIISRFRECFYEQDLFAKDSPLKEEIHFFGRRNYVNELISRHSSGENSGVFGLRRSGKSSVLQAINRASELINTICIIVDCQDLYHSRWHMALYEVMKRIVDVCDLGHTIKVKKDDYSTDNVSISFANHLSRVLDEKANRSILLMFDEIECISPSISMEEAWKSGNDFVMFWQVIRKNFNQFGNRFTFILAGTNPSAIEKITINGYDNPLFNQIKSDSYLPSFTVEDTREMVNKLGGYMGMSFDSIVCSKLTQDFGGHPYLIRYFCSAINKYINGKGIQKPVTVTSAIYDKVMPIFTKNDADRYCNLIIDVLTKNYPQEYKCIMDFALDNNNDELDTIDPRMLSHLMGYNILENNGGVYGFKIDVLKRYLNNKYKYDRKNLTCEEKWAEISERRNNIESKLRSIVKKQLLFSLGESVAKQCVFKSMQPVQRERYKDKKYEELFDPKVSEIFLSQLKTLVDKNWDSCFKNVFTKNRNTIVHYIENLNYFRADAHATEITDSELQAFRDSAMGMEKEIKRYFD